MNQSDALFDLSFKVFLRYVVCSTSADSTAAVEDTLKAH